MVKRRLHVLLGIGERLAADILGARANRGVALLDGLGSGLGGGDELLESLTGLLEVRFRHRSHVLGNLESVSHLVAHGAFLCIAWDCVRTRSGAASWTDAAGEVPL